MPVLDSTQFNQLVQEVREALLAGSQGVGEVEVVKSLENIVSLPSLRLVGRTETVVEAPIELLSAPAVEAAADARQATEDATVSAVNASAAADLAEAERKDLADIKEQTVKAGTDAAARGDKAFSGAMNAENATVYAMQVASYLQTKLEQAQVVIISGKANQEVIEALDSQVKDSILICAGTREEAYAAILQLRELQKQIAEAVFDAYIVFDQMQLSVADCRQATAMAGKAMDRICELSERTERVIVESVLQTGEAKQTVIRLEDMERSLLFSMSAADIAAGHAARQAVRAEDASGEAERLNTGSTLLHERLAELVPVLEKTSGDAKFSAAGADNAAALAREKAGKADDAAEQTLKTKADADIAAARALVAEQKALDATRTVENIVSGIRPDYNESDKTSSNYIANKPEIPTLETAPTAGTLTYTNRDGMEIRFKVGDEVRVLEDDEYIFYKLYDLAEDEEGNPAASWDESGGGTALPGNVYLQGANYYNESVRIIKGGYLNE